MVMLAKYENSNLNRFFFFVFCEFNHEFNDFRDEEKNLGKF